MQRPCRKKGEKPGCTHSADVRGSSGVMRNSSTLRRSPDDQQTASQMIGLPSPSTQIVACPENRLNSFEKTPADGARNSAQNTSRIIPERFGGGGTSSY